MEAIPPLWQLQAVRSAELSWGAATTHGFHRAHNNTIPSLNELQFTEPGKWCMEQGLGFKVPLSQALQVSKSLGAWACQGLRPLLDSSPLTEGIFSRAVVTTGALKQELGELCCLLPAVS